MYIKKLTCRNIRCFEELKIDNCSVTDEFAFFAAGNLHT